MRIPHGLLGLDGGVTMHRDEWSKRKADDAAREGMSKALRAERVQLWKTLAGDELEQMDSGTTFTADDLVAVIGLPDVGPGRNNVVGAWINGRSKKGEIAFTGSLRKSERVARHGNLQRVWIKT